MIYSFLGDFYHPHENIYPTVKAALEAAGETLADSQLADLPAILDNNPAAIIMGVENRLNPESDNVTHWLTPEIDQKIEAYVAAGGSIIALHAAIASYPQGSKYIQMLRGYFISHPDEHCLVSYKGQLGGSHDFQLMDEFYVVDVDQENTNVFLTSESLHGQGIAGWYHNYGNGKAIVIVPTHRKESNQNPATIRLITAGINWALER
ncbi:MAG: ThuA domain-containing protein [Defluviitaleaceae bacterium]|nr:ThuA domain-containing protein [Defluviitaleaceae bacterium]